jgi:hypothetical protein
LNNEISAGLVKLNQRSIKKEGIVNKIPTIFLRNPENRKEVLNQWNFLCDWVLYGEGVATRKYDGACCLIKNGKLFKRREFKKGKPIPRGFIQVEADKVTGNIIGWIEVDKNNLEDQWHRAAFKEGLSDGTYELLGPKIQGNHEKLTEHILLKHSDAEQFVNVPRSIEGIQIWLKDKDIEGLVFHHPDGRMAKIKKRDFPETIR